MSYNTLIFQGSSLMCTLRELVQLTLLNFLHPSDSVHSLCILQDPGQLLSAYPLRLEFIRSYIVNRTYLKIIGLLYQETKRKMKLRGERKKNGIHSLVLDFKEKQWDIWLSKDMFLLSSLWMKLLNLPHFKYCET